MSNFFSPPIFIKGVQQVRRLQQIMSHRDKKTKYDVKLDKSVKGDPNNRDEL